jgi:4-amino-4-deoxy-L-arabinose transferase-like glycosyltransferase
LTLFIGSPVTTHRNLVAIVLLAGVLRIAWVVYAQTVPGSDFAQYDQLAWRLAEGKGYVDELGEPTAFYAIGWPFFLSIVYRVFGHSLVAAGVINALMGVGAVILTYAIARHLLDRPVALISAALVAINPTLVLYSSTHGTESFFILEILLLTWLILRVLESHHALELVLVGILTGFAILTRPVGLCVPLGGVVAVYTFNRHNFRRDFRRNTAKVLVVIAVSAVIVTPWVVRNAVAVDATTLQTSGGVTLWIGNNPQATGGLMPPPAIPGLNAIATPGAGPDATEAEANSAYTSAAIDALLTNPARAVSLVPRKLFELWGGHRHAVTHSTRKSDRTIPGVVLNILPILTQAYLVLLLLLVVAAYGMKRSRNHWVIGPGIALTAIFVFWNAFHMISFGSGRYHVPMEPFLAIMAASAISAVVLANGRSTRVGRAGERLLSGLKRG